MVESFPRSTGISESETLAIASVPSIYVNKIYVTTSPNGIRIAFGDEMSDSVSSFVRSSVYMSVSDAMALRDLLVTFLADYRAVNVFHHAENDKND